jgi:hypothetical protein
MSDHDEIAKRRALADIASGRRKCLTNTFFNRHVWTKDELAFLTQRKAIQVNPTQTIATTDPLLVSIEDVYRTINSHTRREATASTYKSNASSLQQLFNVEMFSDIFNKYSDEEIIDRITNRYANASPYLAIILWLASFNDVLGTLISYDRLKTYRYAFHNAKNIQTAITLANKPTQSASETNVDRMFTTELHLRETKYASNEHLVSMMYTVALYDKDGIIHMIPRNYFANIRLVYDDSKLNKKENFLVVPTGRLILNDYKTSGMYPPYDVILPNVVMDAIRESIKVTPRDYLFVSRDKTPYIASSLGAIIKKIMGLSVDEIRKTLETYEILVKQTDRVHVAFAARHTVSVQEISYLACPSSA